MGVDVDVARRTGWNGESATPPARAAVRVVRTLSSAAYTRHLLRFHHRLWQRWYNPGLVPPSCKPVRRTASVQDFCSSVAHSTSSALVKSERHSHSVHRARFPQPYTSATPDHSHLLPRVLPALRDSPSRVRARRLEQMAPGS